MRFIIAATVTSFALLAGSAAYADSYTVELVKSRNPDNKGQYRVANVEAEITPANGGIVGLFSNNDDVGLPNGWSTFLYKPSATTIDGKSLALTMVGGGKFHVDGWTAGPIKLKYTMLLQHDRFPSDPGDDELAYGRDFGVMWTGRALLVEGAPATDIDIRFDAPSDWAITTPWRADPADAHHFVAKSTDELLDSAIMAGKQEQLTERIGSAEARIGVDPAMHNKEAGLVKTLDQSVDAYQTMFRDPPHDNVVVLLSAASFTGGGVMGRSISFLIGPDYPDPKEFHHVLSHELFHLWTGQWQRADPALTEWLVEGSAEYYSYLSGLRAHRLTEAEFLAELADRSTKYLAALKTTSIADAGRTKLQNDQSSDAVYSGGMMTFFALDALIRERSHNRRSLDDVMRSLNQQSKSKPLSLAAFDDVLTSDGVPRDFVARYIEGSQPLPLGEAFRFYGLELVPAAKPESKADLRILVRAHDQAEAWRRYASKSPV